MGRMGRRRSYNFKSKRGRHKKEERLKTLRNQGRKKRFKT